MKVFDATYAWQGGWGAYEYRDYVIIANTKEEALGLALEAELNTKAENWLINEINTSLPKAHYISGSSS